MSVVVARGEIAKCDLFDRRSAESIFNLSGGLRSRTAIHVLVNGENASAHNHEQPNNRQQTTEPQNKRTTDLGCVSAFAMKTHQTARAKAQHAKA